MSVEAVAVGSGYAQAGASTFNTAVAWLTFGQERQQLERWRREDIALAKEAQGYALQQQRFENLMSERGMGLQEHGFNFARQKWGAEFGLTRKQYNEQMKIAKANERRQAEMFDMEKRKQALARQVNVIDRTLGNDVQMKQLIASRFGA